jgi:hypothetical protein
VHATDVHGIATLTISAKDASGAEWAGGTPAADARARADSWPKLLKVLSKL